MIGPDLPLPLVLTLLGLIGAFVGHFLNICIERFPHHDHLRDQWKSVLSNHTVCRRCSARPSFVERLPVIGWLLGGRRCHACGSLLPVELPVVEFSTALLFVLVYWLEVPVGADARITDTRLSSHEGPPGPEVAALWAPVVWFHARYALHMLMICGLIVATGIDRRHRIIPDGCTLPIIVIAVTAHTVFGQLFIVPIWFQDASMMKQLNPVMPEMIRPLFVPWQSTEFVQEYTRLHALAVSLAGIVVGAGAVWMVRVIGALVLKQEAMGLGDVILMAMIGSVVGWQPVLAVFIFAPVLAISVAIVNWIANKDKHIPYGPFLSAAMILLLVTWRTAWPFAKRFFDMGPFFILMLLFMLVFLAAALQLIQLIKRVMGWNDRDADEDEWPSADQLLYLSQERPDEQTGQWPTVQWPGSRSGRGLAGQHSWRHSND